MKKKKALSFLEMLELERQHAEERVMQQHEVTKRLDEEIARQEHQRGIREAPEFVAKLKVQMLAAARKFKREVELQFDGNQSMYDETKRLLALDEIVNVSERVERYDACYYSEDSYLSHGAGTNHYIKVAW